MDAQMSCSGTRRKVLSQAVCSILSENGFESCERAALETLTEMLQALLYEIGESARNYCEHSGRTEILIADVILALINSGIRIHDIPRYGSRLNRLVLPPLQTQAPPKPLNILQAGVKQSHPPHIPSHLPPLPDPHAYIRTPTHKQPVTEYEAIREKAAQQKRDIERALTRFTAKTGKTHSLFLTEDNSMFPLIGCKPQFPSYLLALLPQDQIFDPDPEYQVVQPETNTTDTKKTENDTEEKNEDSGNENNNESNSEINVPSDAIDNPYLRPGKMPKLRLSSMSGFVENNSMIH